MISYYLFLKILHIACAAVWFGGSISTPGRIRRALILGETEIKWMAMETSRSMKISRIFAGATWLSGLFLVFSVGGFRNVSKSIHMGLGLTTVMLLLEALVIRTLWNGIQKMITEGGDRSAIQPLKAKLAMAGGMQQLLWLLVLVLMVVK